MDKNFIKELNLAFNAAMAYRDTKDPFYYKKGKAACKTLVIKYKEQLMGCEQKYWIAFSFAASMFSMTKINN